MSVRLAFDTATDWGSVAVEKNGRIVSERVFGDRSHASRLMPAIMECLVSIGRDWGEVDELIVADGPGSFTGLRIGFATMKGLVTGHAIPVFVTPSIVALAHAAVPHVNEQPVVAIFDALRGQVFAGVFAFERGKMITHLAPTLTTLEELRDWTGPAPALAIGHGALTYTNAIEDWLGRPPLPGRPHARSLLALRDLQSATHRVSDPLTVEPAYGRSAEAQVRWEREHGRTLPHSTGGR
jgi:tRNA threonylcarbamoyladenosine biosynthesis protein TsaB